MFLILSKICDNFLNIFDFKVKNHIFQQVVQKFVKTWDSHSQKLEKDIDTIKFF